MKKILSLVVLFTFIFGAFANLDVEAKSRSKSSSYSSSKSYSTKSSYSSKSSSSTSTSKTYTKPKSSKSTSTSKSTSSKKSSSIKKKTSSDCDAGDLIEGDEDCYGVDLEGTEGISDSKVTNGNDTIKTPTMNHSISETISKMMPVIKWVGAFLLAITLISVIMMIIKRMKD